VGTAKSASSSGRISGESVRNAPTRQRTGNTRHVTRQIAQIVRRAQEIARRDQQAFTRRSERQPCAWWRMNNCTPNSCSSWVIAAEIEGCEMCTRSEASVMLPASPAATK
jgi:hypothetical protein